MSKFENQIAFLVNNDYEVPDTYDEGKIFRNTKNLPEHEFFNSFIKKAYNPLIKTNVVGFIDSKTRLPSTEDLNKVIIPLFEKEPRLGFVFTDALIKKGEVEFIDYFTGLDLPEISFFANLNMPLEFLPEEQSKVKAMHSMLQRGKVLGHIPDPLLTVYH